MMMPLIAASQGSFYTKNGYLELEGILSPEECDTFFAFMANRDIWRQHPTLKTFILSRRMAGLALYLSGKPSLRLACDQWFPPGFSLDKPTKFKDLFSVQGITSIILIQLQPGTVTKPAKISPLGLFPFPQKQGSALIVTPDLLINWPPHPSIGLYAIAYSIPAAVYIQNPRDPSGLALKQFGYGYGDLLKNDTHPLITSK